MKPAAVVWLGSALIFLALAAVYWGSAGHSRLPEDEMVVWSNSAITGPGMGAAVLGRFYEFTGDGLRPAVRPVATLAQRLGWEVFRQNRAGFQRMQIFLQGMAASLALVLLLQQLGSPIGALVGGLLVALHPAAAASVLKLAGISDLLATIFLLGSLLVVGAILRSQRDGDPPRAAICLACGLFLLALLSKESAFAGAPVVWAWIYARRDRRRNTIVPRLSTLHLLSLGVALAVVVAVAWRLVSLGTLPQYLRVAPVVDETTGLAWGRRMLLGLAAVPTYLRLLLFPKSLGYSYDYLGSAGPMGLRAVAGLAALSGLSAALVLAMRRQHLVTLWIALLLFPLIGSLGVVCRTGSVASDRLLHMAIPGLVGLLVAGVLALRYLTARVTTSVAALVLGILIAGVFGWRTNRRSQDFTEWERVVKAQIATFPGSAQGHFDLGNIYLTRGQWSGSRSEYEEAIRLRPGFWMAWVNLGASYFGQDEPGLAFRAFERVLYEVRGKPAFATVEAKAEYNRALVLMQQNRNVEAARALTRTLEVFPDHLLAHANIGMIYSNNAQFDAQARYHLGRAMALELDLERRKTLERTLDMIEQRRQRNAARGAATGGAGSSEVPPDSVASRNPDGHP